MCPGFCNCPHRKKAENFICIFIDVYTKMSSKIVVRISEELKQEMKKLKDVNWSEVVREAIRKKINEERCKLSVDIMDRLSKKIRLEKPSEQIIREMRDERWKK